MKALLLIALLLTACGGGDPEPESCIAFDAVAALKNAALPPQAASAVHAIEAASCH